VIFVDFLEYPIYKKFRKDQMKKVKSLKDLSNFMEKLGATKEIEPGFTSWTLHCGPDREKRQAATNLEKLNVKKRR
jgi:hypothetical protein